MLVKLQDIDLPGIRFSLSPRAMIVSLEQKQRVLASSLIGGGLQEAHSIVNMHVVKGYANLDPNSDFQDLVKGYGVSEPAVGLLTAAYVMETRIAYEETPLGKVYCLATAGLSNANAAGYSLPYDYQAGTINFILLVEQNLTDGALVNAVITATEAKTAELHRKQILTPEGFPATGTSTDTIAIASLGKGAADPFAGPATWVGWAIARTVRESLAAFLGWADAQD